MLDSNQRRILHNTGMLYVRMLLAMAVGLYTSRVVLSVLGVEDFGTFHVVAGFVALLGFMQGAMISATQRYFAFDLGRNDGGNLQCLFNTSLQIHALLAVLIVLIAETIGYWFVSTQLSIPPGRIHAALSAYHLSVASFAVSVMTVPLTAMLMANERMGLFAVMSMADILLKLVAVLILPSLGFDKLSGYAAMLLLVAVLTFIGYLMLNQVVFPAARLKLTWHADNFRKMLGFTVWNTWGNLAAAMSEHGNNVLLNIFFGPAVNASRSISSQANGALNSFVLNVQAAVNPQIVKLYASGDTAAMHQLVLRAAKYNFYVLLTLALPVLLNTEALLRIWLVTAPPYTAVFLQLTIITSLINSVSGSLMTSAQATGHIRLYHTVVGGVLLLNVPLSYVLLKYGMPPHSVMLVAVGLAVIALIARLFIIAPLIGLSIYSFLSRVGLKVTFVAAFVVSVAFFIQIKKVDSLLILFCNVLIEVALALAVIWIAGLDKAEKRSVVNMFNFFRVRMR